MSSLGRFLTSLIIALVATAGLAQTYPKATKIAIVPVFNQSGEKWVKLQNRQAEAGNKCLVEEFTKHGFSVVPADDVSKAIAELKIDLSDEEQRTRSNFYGIGQRTGAQLVIYPVIIASRQGKTGGFFPKEQGAVTIKLWLLDAVKKEPIINAVTATGKASGNPVLLTIDKGSDLQVKAVGHTLKDHLKKFFASCHVTGD